METKSLRSVFSNGTCNNAAAPEPSCPPVYFLEYWTTPLVGGLETTARVRSRNGVELSSPGRCEFSAVDADSTETRKACYTESGGGEKWCDEYCQGGARYQSPQSRRGEANFVKASLSSKPVFNVDACCINTPIVLDLANDGFAMTSFIGGVYFDFNADGVRSVMAWTAPGSDDAWLVLDRNGNGRIDDGTELFGNASPQPNAVGRHNGFLALAELDRLDNGGNGDGNIDAADTAFSNLKLWQDGNHNGFSETDELSTLLAKGVTSLETLYKEIRRKDRYGNEFRYKGVAVMGDKKRNIYDVIMTDR
jgi:hypothetical protein